MELCCRRLACLLLSATLHAQPWHSPSGAWSGWVHVLCQGPGHLGRTLRFPCCLTVRTASEDGRPRAGCSESPPPGPRRGGGRGLPHCNSMQLRVRTGRTGKPVTQSCNRIPEEWLPRSLPPQACEYVVRCVSSGISLRWHGGP